MFKIAKPLFLTCETPLHAGSGDALGVVDLPIQRERHTSFPKIEASSLKGALREAFEEKFLKDFPTRNEPQLIKAFGPDTGDLHAGALGFTDARLLLFPVKSMKGVFAWVTCPRVLQQLHTDLQHADTPLSIEGLEGLKFGSNDCYVLQGTTLLVNNQYVLLEEYAFKKKEAFLNITINGNDSIPLQDWLANNLFLTNSYWQSKVKTDIVLLSDDDFKDFVNLSTEVITRTKIDNDTGTVATGALFTEEYLPAESVLYALVLASPEFLDEKQRKAKENRTPESAAKIMSFFEKTLPKVIQLGGNATLGKGLLKTAIV
jgi:CRISPR-associated protein Cmr4